LSMWGKLSSSHSKPEMMTAAVYQFAYTEHYSARAVQSDQLGGFLRHVALIKLCNRNEICGQIVCRAQRGRGGSLEKNSAGSHNSK